MASLLSFANGWTNESLVVRGTLECAARKKFETFLGEPCRERDARRFTEMCEHGLIP